MLNKKQADSDPDDDAPLLKMESSLRSRKNATKLQS